MVNIILKTPTNKNILKSDERKSKKQWQMSYFLAIYPTFTCTTPLVFFCLGCNLNIWSDITTGPACSSGTMTNLLPHRYAFPQTQNMTPHPVTSYRHRVDLLLCYHWCETSHCNTQLPILLSWVRLIQNIWPCAHSLFWLSCVYTRQSE